MILPPRVHHRRRTLLLLATSVALCGLALSGRAPRRALIFDALGGAAHFAALSMPEKYDDEDEVDGFVAQRRKRMNECGAFLGREAATRISYLHANQQLFYCQRKANACLSSM